MSLLMISGAAAAAYGWCAVRKLCRRRLPRGADLRRVAASDAACGTDSPSLREQHAFIDAAKANNFEVVRQLVLARPALVNCQPGHRWSALHHVAEKGNIAAVHFLLDHGASTALRTRDGFTPVEVAKEKVFEVLLLASLAESSAAEAAEEEQLKRAANEDAINRLPSWSFRANEQHGEIECHICLEDYEDGETLRKLHCGHSFHARCVDAWLKEKNCCCPVCRADCTTISSSLAA